MTMAYPHEPSMKMLLALEVSIGCGARVGANGERILDYSGVRIAGVVAGADCRARPPSATA